MAVYFVLIISLLKYVSFDHPINVLYLNLEGHQNRITGSRVTAILLNGWIFPIGQSGEASRWRVCYQRGLPRLVSGKDCLYW